MRLSFLRDASDRVELEDRESDSELMRALESIGPKAFGGRWGDKFEAPLLMDISRFRRYRFESTRDLLRVIRNKLNHYMELPKALQVQISLLPFCPSDGFSNQLLIILLITVFHLSFLINVNSLDFKSSRDHSTD